MIKNCCNKLVLLNRSSSRYLLNNQSVFKFNNNYKSLLNNNNNINNINNPNSRLFSTSNNNNKMSGPKPGATEENMRIDPNNTFFAKIVSGEVPVKKVYEDEYCIAFDDIAPVAPVHTLVVPKYPVGGVGDVAHVDLVKHKEAMGHIMATIPHIASLKGIDSYRLVVNEGANAGQSVRWLHIHIIGGRQMNWPPG